MSTSEINDHFINTVEAARLLGVRPSTLRARRHDKREPVPSIRVGSAVLYSRAAVLAYVSRRAGAGEVIS